MRSPRRSIIDRIATDMNWPIYRRPTTLTEAIQLLADSKSSFPLSGGTDLAVAMRHGNLDPEVIVDIKGIPEFASSIERHDGRLVISANTVMTDLEHHEGIRRSLPGLVEAARVVGSVQIRNRATLAGNLCNASPAADTPPVLMALQAGVQIRGPAGSRALSIDDFLVGYRTTALEPGELIEAIHIPEPTERSSSAFLKLGVRRAMGISLVCVGASISLDADGTIARAGLGLGSVAPHTIRPVEAERMIVGNLPSEDLFASAGELAGEGSSPIDDLRASGGYRKAMVPVLVRRALTTAYQRALGMS
ncbi:MAG: xanthine dehydrogenase family protein subunit M [Acidimicrobiia bacterium]|nr:xanthine dehydrogenase family protein subunit M [Acidimicrobiia bacterium]